MAKIHLYSLIIAVGLNLLGCGKNSGDTGQVAKVTPPITNNSSFLTKVQETTYFCDEAECPDYTVAIAVNNLGDINPTWCTGTILKNGQVLTAKSCFEDFFFESNGSCLDNVLVKNLKGEIFGCSSASSYSPVVPENAKDNAAKISDYVLLNIPQIQSTKYPTLAIEKGALQPGKETSLWAVNHWYDDGKEVALTHHKCFYQDNSLISPWGNTSSHLFLSQCELTKSAKGAAILDTNNHLVGVVHYTSKNSDLEIWDHRVLSGETLKHYALGNSLACSTLSTNNYDYCDQKTFNDNKLASLRNAIFTSYGDLDKWETIVQKFAQQNLDKYLRWTAKLRYDNISLSYAVNFIPRCFTDGKVWLLEFRGGLFNMFYDKSGSVFKAWPKLEIYSALNRDFNAQIDLLDNGEYLYEVRFSPRDLKKENKSDLAVINTNINSTIVELKDVPVCQ